MKVGQRFIARWEVYLVRRQSDRYRTARNRGCVKTPALGAKGAKSNSLGQRPRSAVHGVLRALKARNNNRRAESDNKYTGFNIYCAPSALRNLKLSPPGPLAQAFTFRAFGADGWSFHTASVATGCCYSTRKGTRDLIPELSDRIR